MRFTLALSLALGATSVFAGAASRQAGAGVVRMGKRQGSLTPVVVVGDSNPPIDEADLNDVPVEAPAEGTQGGGMGSFSNNKKRSVAQPVNGKSQTMKQKRELAKRQLTPVVVVGTSNPPIDPADLNDVPVEAPAEGTRGGGMGSFNNRRR